MRHVRRLLLTKQTQFAWRHDRETRDPTDTFAALKGGFRSWGRGIGVSMVGRSAVSFEFGDLRPIRARIFIFHSGGRDFRDGSPRFGRF